jgi:hypothetical protein
MIESSDRVEQFKADIADMRLKDPAVGRDTQLLKLGVGLMAVGIGLTVVAYFVSHGTNSQLTQNDAQTVGMIGIALAVVGGALFLRYSIAQFLRFWLARLIYEMQAQTDRVLGTARPSPIASADSQARPAGTASASEQPVGSEV